MPVATGPIAVTPGTTTALANPLPSPAGTPWFVLVGNNSAYPILMNVAGVQTWVQPFTASLLSGEGSGEITATTNALPNGSVGPGTPAYLTLTWALYPETIPGNYPCPLPLPTSAPGAVAAAGLALVNADEVQVLITPGAGQEIVLYGLLVAPVNDASSTVQNYVNIIAVTGAGGVAATIAVVLAAPNLGTVTPWTIPLPGNGLGLGADNVLDVQSPASATGAIAVAWSAVYELA